jgi:Ni,Fe-hydrogenase III small subunit
VANILQKIRDYRRWGLRHSPWVFHISVGSCNNCDIEILDALTPKFDPERFGVLLVGSPRHADILLVAGIVNQKSLDRLIRVYQQTPKPCLVAAVGTCACGIGVFQDAYNTAGPLDRHIPVDIYIPGCPPKPEAILAGLLKALSRI